MKRNPLLTYDTSVSPTPRWNKRPHQLLILKTWNHSNKLKRAKANIIPFIWCILNNNTLFIELDVISLKVTPPPSSPEDWVWLKYVSPWKIPGWFSEVSFVRYTCRRRELGKMKFKSAHARIIVDICWCRAHVALSEKELFDEIIF